MKAAQTPGGATPRYQEPNLKQLAQPAEIILVGRCRSMESRWNSNGRLIYTYVTYQVEELVKGPQGIQQVIVKTLGGTVGRISQMIVDGPKFAVGERDLLFLVQSEERGTLELKNPMRGKLKVQADPVMGDLVLTSGSTMGPLAPLGGGQAQPSAAAASPGQQSAPLSEAEPLKKALVEIRGYLKAAKKD